MPTWIRVRDKETRHEYDVDSRAFDENLHERVTRKGVEDVTGPGARPRPAKPHVKPPKAGQPVQNDKES